MGSLPQWTLIKYFPVSRCDLIDSCALYRNTAFSLRIDKTTSALHLQTGTAPFFLSWDHQMTILTYITLHFNIFGHFFNYLDDGSSRQVEAWKLLLAKAAGGVIAQEVLQQFAEWLLDQPPKLRRGLSTTHHHFMRAAFSNAPPPKTWVPFPYNWTHKWMSLIYSNMVCSLK